MEERVAAVHSGESPELVWFLEHPPLYTAGTSAKPKDLVDPKGRPVYKTGRGGQYTYHGPGQRVVYVMHDLSRRGRDLRGHVDRLERWVIAALADFGVTGVTRPDRVGIWVERGTDDDGKAREDKIAAVGVRVRRWVTYHGIAVNVCPKMKHFRGIVPCGIDDPGLGVTSLKKLKVNCSLADFDAALARHYTAIFGEDEAASEQSFGKQPRFEGDDRRQNGVCLG